jgi:hypothetical protein
MTDISCNGWRNAATWTVNLWFGDSFAAAAEEGEALTPIGCRETVEAYVDEIIGFEGTSGGFLWDMLDLNSVDWAALAEHHKPETPYGEELCRNGIPIADCTCC